MNVYLDANILVSVLNKEYPLFTFSSRILSLSASRSFKLYTSPLCLAIAFYFAEKKQNASTAKEKINLLYRHIRLTDNSAKAVLKSLQNPAVNDFEDGLEYYAAVEKNCKCLITENKADFYFADMEVLSAVEFCVQYLPKKRK